jgi:glycosyltransferase involved in cell wall biosynthesis
MRPPRPVVTFVIPALNAESLLGRALASIRRQDYPQDSVEVIVADGGSTDRTGEVAASFGARILDNPERLAEFGVKVGILAAGGELVVIFAADNELVGTTWLSRVVARFEEDPELAAAYGRLISGSDDPALNKYVALIQSDPLTWFLNRNLERYLQDRRPDPDGGYSFEIDPDYPLVWGANGLVLRTAWARPHWQQEGYVADVDAFHGLVRAGHRRVVYYPDAFCYHHQIGTLADFRRKWLRNLRHHLVAQAGSRDLSWVLVPGFRRRALLWLPYSLLLPVSLADSLRRAVGERSQYWLFHPVVSFLQTLTYAQALLVDRAGRALIRSALLSRRR